MSNPIDFICEKLDEMRIPYKKYVELMPDDFLEKFPCYNRSDADKYSRNQIIYGELSGDQWKDHEHPWKLDAIYQNWSYGREQGLVEVWGNLIEGDPVEMDPFQFVILVIKDYFGIDPVIAEKVTEEADPDFFKLEKGIAMKNNREGKT